MPRQPVGALTKIAWPVGVRSRQMGAQAVIQGQDVFNLSAYGYKRIGPVSIGELQMNSVAKQLPNETKNLVGAFSHRFLEAAELSAPTRSKQLPLVLETDGDKSLDSLIALVEANKEYIFDNLHRYGGVLFRGFEVNNAQDFESVLLTLDLTMAEEFTGVSARTRLHNGIYTSTELPHPVIINPHVEMAYCLNRPKWISFFCELAAKVGGETPIFDCRAMYQSLRPATQELLRKNRIKYSRYLKGKERNGTLPMWPEKFGTEDKAKVEELVKQHPGTCRWLPNDDLIVESATPAIVAHPDTNELCLHMNIFHWWEIVRNAIALLGKPNRMSMIREYAFRLSNIIRGTSNLVVTFEDGSPIPWWVMDDIHNAFWDNSVLFTWKKGDILLLDNDMASHSRMSYLPPRKILTAFGGLWPHPEQSA